MLFSCVGGSSISLPLCPLERMVPSGIHDRSTHLSIRFMIRSSRTSTAWATFSPFAALVSKYGILRGSVRKRFFKPFRKTFTFNVLPPFDAKGSRRTHLRTCTGNFLTSYGCIAESGFSKPHLFLLIQSGNKRLKSSAVFFFFF